MTKAIRKVSIGFFLSLILAVMMCGTRAFAAESGGTCGAEGNNLTWEYDSNGTLTISGSGAMMDYSDSSSPWYDIKDNITNVVIEDEVTSIGNYAFYECSNIQSISIPNGVYTIGDSVFYNCSSLSSITIPFSVKSIGSNSFSGCDGIKQATFPAGLIRFMNGIPYSATQIRYSEYNDKIIFQYLCLGTQQETFTVPDTILGKSVTSIASFAFSECKSLTSITLPDSIITIGYRAFGGLSNLKSIIIPNSVTKIGDSAFNGCSGLASINIPKSVTQIGDSAFNDCSSLSSINIPESITKIGDKAFGGCTKLTDITVDENNSVYCSINGVLFSKDKSTLIFYPSNKSEQSYSIPDSVNSIGNNAFYGCSRLTGINIRISVGHIGDSAFEGCSGLTAITLPKNIASIGSRVFYGCSSLKSISIPDNVSSIGDSAFYGCSRLTSITIPDGVISISDSAFYDCSGLTIITIPDSVTSIGSSAFYGCSGIASVAFPKGISSISDSAFYGCSGLTSITIPDGVTSIGDSAFYGCSGFTSIAIPDGVTSIGGSAFYGCSGLTSITIPDSVTSIGSSAFSCEKLSTAFIPEGNLNSLSGFPNTTTKIFYSPKNNDNAVTITRVLLGQEQSDVEIVDNICGKNVTAIAEKAFTYESGYYRLKKATLPDTITSIGDSAFADCTKLTSVNIPPKVTSIGKCVFYNCKSLTGITIPNGVSSIGLSAFYLTGLTSIEIPESVTSIGSYAFYSDIQIVFLPENLTSIAADAFTADTTQVRYKSENEKAKIIRTTLGTNKTSVSIPKTICSKAVTSIENKAFYECSSLKKISIPVSVTSIGDNAFAYTGLTSLIIPYSVTTIGNSAFCHCEQLENITISQGVKSIGEEAFAYTAITSISLPDGILSIGDSAFANTAVKSITLPDSLSFIGNSAFEACTVLSSIAIPNGVTHIGDSAFANTAIKSIIVPDSVTSIGASAFANCSCLEYIFLPASLSADGSFNIPETATRVKYTTELGKVKISEIALGTGKTAIDIPKTLCVCGKPIVYVNKAYRDKVGAHSCVGIAGICGLCGNKYYVPAHYASAVGHSITLADSIGVNFIMDLGEGIVADETAVMIFTVNGKETIVPVKNAKTELIEDGTVYSFACNVAAAEMTDYISAQITAGEYSSDVFTYNVQSYAKFILNNEDVFGEYISIVKAMLNYGAEAQKYFNHNTENLANSILDESDRIIAPVTSDELSAFKYAITDNDADVDFIGYVISLQDTVTLKLYFRGKEFVVSDFTVFKEGNRIEVSHLSVGSDSNGMYLAISDITPGNFDQCFAITTGGVSIRNISVYSYLQQCIAKERSELFGVINALYAFNEAAETIEA